MLSLERGQFTGEPTESDVVALVQAHERNEAARACSPGDRCQCVIEHSVDYNSGEDARKPHRMRFLKFLPKRMNAGMNRATTNEFQGRKRRSIPEVFRIRLAISSMEHSVVSRHGIA